LARDLRVNRIEPDTHIACHDKDRILRYNDSEGKSEFSRGQTRGIARKIGQRVPQLLFLNVDENVVTYMHLR
jgi:hypothetical protein